jgi:hypothetical protein
MPGAKSLKLGSNLGVQSISYVYSGRGSATPHYAKRVCGAMMLFACIGENASAHEMAERPGYSRVSPSDYYIMLAASHWTLQKLCMYNAHQSPTIQHPPLERRQASVRLPDIPRDNLTIIFRCSPIARNT